MDDDHIRHPYIAPMLLPTWYSARYVRWIEIDDTTNPDGYIQIGRVLSAGFTPAGRGLWAVRGLGRSKPFGLHPCQAH